MNMKRLIACIIATMTLSSLSAQTNPLKTFFCADFNQGKIFEFQDGKIVWEHKAPASNDVWVLKNGNRLFTTGHGVLEVTVEKDTVFYYHSAESEIFACQRLKNGNTFVGECTTGRLLEVNKKGEIVKELTIGKEKDPYFMRNARRLDNGHYLVAHYGGKRVTEYDKKGRIVWEASIPGGAHSVARLKNGHTVVAATDKARDAKIIEFDKKGNIVWELSNDDLENNPLQFMSGFQYLPESDTFLLTNWKGHNMGSGVPLIIWVSRDKKILGTIPAHERLVTVASIFVEGSSTRYNH